MKSYVVDGQSWFMILLTVVDKASNDYPTIDGVGPTTVIIRPLMCMIHGG